MFLAIEVGQNQSTLEEQLTLSRLSARDAATDRFNEFTRLLLENPHLEQSWSKGIAGEELTDSETAQFQRMCFQQLYDRLSMYLRFDAIELPLEADVQISAYGRTIAQSEALVSCWESQRDAIAARGYGDFVLAVEQAAGME